MANPTLQNASFLATALSNNFKPISSIAQNEITYLTFLFYKLCYKIQINNI